MTNISGQWAGVYSYPRRLAPTSFDAELRDHDGLLTGLITEIGDSRRSQGQLLQSTVVGTVSASAVRFTKIYDDVVRSHSVIYDGDISDDGNVIEGTWHIVGNWSGPFRMEKRTGGASVEEEVGEEITVS